MYDYLYALLKNCPYLLEFSGVGYILYTLLEDALAEHPLEDLSNPKWTYVGALDQANNLACDDGLVGQP